MGKEAAAMDKRIEAVDKRFEAVDNRFPMLTWFIGIAFVVVNLTIVALKVF
jgi:hypothetical protein